jgi:putative transposase
MLAEALRAEVDAYIAAHAAERDKNGRRLVVRNGYHQPREVLTSAGAIDVTARGSTTSAPTRPPGSARSPPGVG